jgi:hypothetical protein
MYGKTISALILLICLSSFVFGQTVEEGISNEIKNIEIKTELSKDGTIVTITQLGFFQGKQVDEIFFRADLPPNETYKGIEVTDLITNKKFNRRLRNVTNIAGCDGMFSVDERKIESATIQTVTACVVPQGDEFNMEIKAIAINEGGENHDACRRLGKYAQDLSIHATIPAMSNFAISLELSPDLADPLTNIPCPENSTQLPLENGQVCNFFPSEEKRIIDADFKLRGTDRHLLERQEDKNFQAELTSISVKAGATTALLASGVGALLGAALTFITINLFEGLKRRRRLSNVLLTLKLRTLFVVENASGFIKELKKGKKRYCPYSINSMCPVDFSLSFDDIYHEKLPDLINRLFEIEDKIKIANDYNRILRESKKETENIKKIRKALLDLLSKELIPKLRALYDEVLKLM